VCARTSLRLRSLRHGLQFGLHPRLGGQGLGEVRQVHRIQHSLEATESRGIGVGQTDCDAGGFGIESVIVDDRPDQAPAFGIDGREFLPEQQQPFRADWTGWALMDLLKIQWNGQMPERNVLGDRYRWEAPKIPVAVESFSR